MRISALALVLLLAGCPSAPPEFPSRGGLVINEVMAANDSVHRDPANATCPEFDDWIEIYNDSGKPAPLGGVELRDSKSAFSFPEVELEPDGRIVVWADKQPEQGPLHADFAISADGEQLTLLRDGKEVDSVEVPKIRRDQSWARLRDGGDEWIQVGIPTPGAPNHRVFPDDPCLAPKDGFDDHGYPCLRDRDSFLSLAGARTELNIVKFDIFAFGEPEKRRISFVDSEFYTLHDQYYIFTVLNGHTFEGLVTYPPYPGEFRTWTELDEWARAHEDLELDFDRMQLRFSGDRLYSSYFYDAINGEDRVLGVGTVIFREATADRPAFWGFELEYGDRASYEDIVIYFETLERFGPAEFTQIRWLIRSPAQESIARRMEDRGLRYADRITRYAELATPGEVQVYNPGRTAGRVRIIRAGEGGLENSRSTDVLVLDEIPDYLPPCAALITSVPQTPLSHISLLARSRGIPNLYVAGITSDPEWDAWARTRRRAVVEATGDDGFRSGLIIGDDYETWRRLQTAGAPQIVPVDSAELPYAIDLANAVSMVELRTLVGGKAAGMRQLLLEPTLDAPDTPMGLSIRGYDEHIANLAWLPQLLATPSFLNDGTDATRERFLILEGRAAYTVRYPLLADASAAQSFLAHHPPGDRAGDLARAQGLRGAIANATLPPQVAAALRDAISTQFSWLDPAQGLRFRSSSTVEDVEGFNGAGLYISATGFRAPAQGQASVEDAILAVWASYWGAEAFEERRSADLEHLDGGMGILVHPRFDDELERSNHVLTTTLFPDGHMEMRINAQEGATSVANPPTTCPPVLPESALVSDTGGGVAITRLQPSTELPEGQEVLTDAQLSTLFHTSAAVVRAWLAEENAILPATHARSVLTLDLESREMAAGWPSGTSDVDRLVIKQSRSLEPSASFLPDDLQALPAPRDTLARAAAIRKVSCGDERMTIHVSSVTTDPLQPPDMGWSEERFVIQVELEALRSVPELEMQAGDSIIWSHVDLVSAQHDDDLLLARRAVGGATVQAGRYQVQLAEGTAEGTAECESELLWASPDTFLLEFLD
jgi:hypothetical protein